jgi:hypothetical protein
MDSMHPDQQSYPVAVRSTPMSCLRADSQQDQLLQYTDSAAFLRLALTGTALRARNSHCEVWSSVYHIW